MTTVVCSTRSRRGRSCDDGAKGAYAAVKGLVEGTHGPWRPRRRSRGSGPTSARGHHAGRRHHRARHDRAARRGCDSPGLRHARRRGRQGRVVRRGDVGRDGGDRAIRRGGGRVGECAPRRARADRLPVAPDRFPMFRYASVSLETAMRGRGCATCGRDGLASVPADLVALPRRARATRATRGRPARTGWRRATIRGGGLRRAVRGHRAGRHIVLADRLPDGGHRARRRCGDHRRPHPPRLLGLDQAGVDARISGVRPRWRAECVAYVSTAGPDWELQGYGCHWIPRSR